MEALRIGTFAARYRLPRRQRATRDRLDRLLAEMLDERLADELAGAGLDASEEVCVRAVDAPVRVRLAAGDAALAREWARAVAAAIGEAVRRGGPGVVRYGSRRHALLDVVLGVAQGRLGRAWAWRRLGLWEAPGEPGSPEALAQEALARLRAEPAAVAPVLAAVARADAPALARVLAAAGAPAWRALAAAALAAAGVDAEELWRELARRRPGAGDAVVPFALAPSVAEADPAAAASLRAALREALTRSAGAGAGEAATLAALAVLAADPGPQRVAALAARVARVAEALLGAAAAGVAETDDARATRDGEGAPSGERAPRATGPGAVRPHRSVAPEDERDEALASVVAEPEGSDDADDPVPARVSGATRAGGLLYLLNLVEALELLERLPAERPVRWSLHAVALLLAPVERDDPAALAFCGLPPDAEPPDERARPPREDETALLEAAAERLTARAAELLDPDADPDETLTALVLRPAEIVADPGWIDVRLRLDDVTTELRRSGLDLDPGWLPWLGCVVRFVYA
jgi:hypothetical protein